MFPWPVRLTLRGGTRPNTCCCCCFFGFDSESNRCGEGLCESRGVLFMIGERDRVGVLLGESVRLST